jgi:hypothetical protein
MKIAQLRCVFSILMILSQGFTSSMYSVVSQSNWVSISVLLRQRLVEIAAVRDHTIIEKCSSADNALGMRFFLWQNIGMAIQHVTSQGEHHLAQVWLSVDNQRITLSYPCSPSIRHVWEEQKYIGSLHCLGIR